MASVHAANGGRNDAVRKILGGNADNYENKGVEKKGIQKMLKTDELKIDGSRDAVRVEAGGRDETGTLSATFADDTLSVTICQLLNK